MGVDVKMKTLLCIFSGVIVCTVLTAPLSSAEDMGLVTVQELRQMLSNSNVIVVDVRAQSDWDNSDNRITGALRENPKNVTFWMHNYPSNKKLIFYCD